MSITILSDIGQETRNLENTLKTTSSPVLTGTNTGYGTGRPVDNFIPTRGRSFRLIRILL